MKITGYTESKGRFSPLAHTLDHAVGDRGNRLLGDIGAVYLGQVRGDLTVGQSLGRQRHHHVIDPRQAALAFRYELRGEATFAVAGHTDLDRAGVGQHRLDSLAVAGVLPVTAGRVVLAVAEVVIEFAFQRGLDHRLRQLPQQPALTSPT
jgi:hypothetical protein